MTAIDYGQPGSARLTPGSDPGQPASAVPDLAALQQRAAERAAERAGGRDRLRGHIVCDGLVRIFKTEGVEVVALQGLDLVIDRGELVAIVGASGSGKSTLLNILSGLDTPTAGIARVADYDLLALSNRRRLAYRRQVVGFVWQQTGRNLLPYLTALENVELPMKLAGGRSRRARRERARELLDLVGVGYCADRRPGQMSGGEQQRCAVAVSVANDPEVLFADEPTGELDEATGAEVFAALRTINAELGVTIVVVTHDHAVAGQVRRTVAIRDGRTASEVRRTARLAADGSTELVSEEYAVLDRTGRMQLPASFVDALSLRDRVRLNLEPDHVEVRPGDRAHAEESE
ncbi:ABC transporter ATP-binding protein [Micromonospora chersina]|uniref:ABC transporter ATP-binding protein n=1 Tax=Micromonospora chersina TaxID=47854 RepID=UPI0033F9C419